MFRKTILVVALAFPASAFAGTETSEVSHKEIEAAPSQESSAKKAVPAVPEQPENEGCIPSEEREGALIC